MHFNSLSAGKEDFAGIMESGGYYVDKTPYLKELFMGINRGSNELILRPRRFGKTLSLSMIYEFCRLDCQNVGDLSRQKRLFLSHEHPLAVAAQEYRELRERFMGQIPVIFVSFREIEGHDFKSALSSFLNVIASLYDDFIFLAGSTRQTVANREKLLDYYNFSKRNNRKLNNDDLVFEAKAIASDFIPALATMLYREYDRQVLILIDEYDVPLQKSVTAPQPYYDDMLEIIRKLCVTTFKQVRDPWLLKGIVTGCLRVAHQSVFTGANNFVTSGMDSAAYAALCGFTREETHRLLCDMSLESKESEVREWYDGYRFGPEHIYCPWSLMNYCAQTLSEAPSGREASASTEPASYWVGVSSNDIIELYVRNRLASEAERDLELMQRLLDGQEVEATLQDFTTYPDLTTGVSFDEFATMLLQTGYLTFTEDSPQRGKVTLKIPNREVKCAFTTRIASVYNDRRSQWWQTVINMAQALIDHQTEQARELINTLLSTFISVHDPAYEGFYHAFIQGVLAPAAADLNYKIVSQRESGSGYYDLALYHRNRRKAVIMEFKKSDGKYKHMVKAAQSAADQIIRRDYARQFIEDGYREVYGLGIAFGGKGCELIDLGNLAAPES